MRKWRRRRERQNRRQWLHNVERVSISRVLENRWFQVFWLWFIRLFWITFFVWIGLIKAFVKRRILGP